MINTYPIIVVCSGYKDPIDILKSDDYKFIDNIKHIDSNHIVSGDINSEYRFVFFAEVKGVDKNNVKDFMTVSIQAIKGEIIKIVFL
jgi:hypothetical protein